MAVEIDFSLSPFKIKEQTPEKQLQAPKKLLRLDAFEITD